MFYRLRRWFTRLFGTLGAGRCYGCNAKLDAVELEMYAISCHRCDDRWTKRMEYL